MSFSEQGWSNVPELENCHTACVEATILARSQLYAQLGGKSPLDRKGQQQFAIDVLRILNLAQEGFTLYKRAADYVPSQIRDLIVKTTPANYVDINRELEGMGFSALGEAVRVINASPQGTAYKTVRGTLDDLTAKSNVTFYDFIVMDGINLGEIENLATYWRFNLTPDFVWDTIHRMKRVAKQMGRNKRINFEELLKAGHFFASASNFPQRKQILE